MEAINLRTQKLNFCGIDPKLGVELLSIFWKRQISTGTIVYRPYFMRDMACQGPYFSELLLNSIFFVASRLNPVSEMSWGSVSEMKEAGRPFLDRINDVLYDRNNCVLLTSSIPTIQALLLISDNLFAAYSEKSLSWQYLGIAISMIVDLGIHTEVTSSREIASALPEDIETRRRVFWTAFCELTCLLPRCARTKQRLNSARQDTGAVSGTTPSSA